MAKPPPFELLKDLAQESMEKAHEAVAEALAQETQAKLQLEKLQQYRHDYLEQLQATMQRGVRSSIANNAQRFIDNIDEAIARQSEQIQVLGKNVQDKREQWLLERKKVESMGTLLDRQRAKQTIQESRREQKQNDEYAARAYRRMQLV